MKLQMLILCLQENLVELMETWNTHTLQSLPNGNDRGKRPILRYSLPQLYNAQDHTCTVEHGEVEICENQTSPGMLTCSDETVGELCEILMEENALSEPFTATEAKELYIQLRQIIKLEMSRV